MLKDRFRLHKEVHHGKRSRKKRLGTLFTDFSRCCSWQFYQPADKRSCRPVVAEFWKKVRMSKTSYLKLTRICSDFRTDNQIHHWQYYWNYCRCDYISFHLRFYHSRFFRLVKGTIFAYQNNLNLRVFFLKSNCLFFSHN